MRWLIVMCFALVSFSAMGNGEHQKEVEAAQALLEAAYNAPDTANFCVEYPTGTYFMTIAKITVAVDCKLRNEWLRILASQ